MGWLKLILGGVFPSWLLPVAAVTGVLFVLSGAYIKGYRDASQSCQAAALAAQIRVLKKDIAIQDAADKQETIALERMDKENSSLKAKVKTYVDAQNETSCVLTPDDISKLRELRR